MVESWTASLVDVVPIEQEEEIMFEHEHDGIRELDNNLPPWWLYGFYFTIVFAVFYTVHFLITPVPGLDIVFGPGIEQEEMYEIEMAEAEEAKAAYLAQLSNLIDENNVEAKLDPATLAEGQEIWIANCANCHRADGGGDVGPNMTDAYWLHGGGIQNIFKTVKYGVDGKGMIAWEGQLSPGQMQSVASYVLSLGGTTPEIAKEPQGEIWEAPAAQPENEATMDSTATAAEEVPEDIPQDDVPTEDNQTDQ